MIELTAPSWGLKVTSGAVTVELDGIGTNRQGGLVCQLNYGLTETDEFSLVINSEGFFEVVSETRPVDVELGGNVLMEAEDPTKLGLWEYVWNPISKILRGRVAL